MKVAFVVNRRPDYRLLAPVIETALRQGWQVECWLNYGWPRDGLKAYQFPDQSITPTFRCGRPKLRRYHAREELQALARSTDADGVVSTIPLDVPRVSLAVQHATDMFLSYSPEEILACDSVALYSDWWLEWMVDYFESQRRIDDRAAFTRRFAPRSAITGLSALDASMGIDPNEVRDRWGIRRGPPVVLLMPFPQGVGKPSFWPRHIFGEPSRVRQLLYAAMHGRLDYWSQVGAGTRDVDIVKAIRRFCDRHGALLVVKSRFKTPIPAYTQEVADKCLYDESFYPPTVLEALSIADLCISYYSATVMEAAPLGVPHLCITFDGNEYCGSDWLMRAYFNRFFNRAEGGVFQFEGVTTTISIPEAVELLERATLDDFRIDPDARRRYVLKFLGFDDFNASARILARLAETVERRDGRVGPEAGIDPPPTAIA